MSLEIVLNKPRRRSPIRHWWLATCRYLARPSQEVKQTDVIGSPSVCFIFSSLLVHPLRKLLSFSEIPLVSL